MLVLLQDGVLVIIDWGVRVQVDNSFSLDIYLSLGLHSRNTRKVVGIVYS